jgi:uncharacterized protein YlxW (UPF0749 family)
MSILLFAACGKESSPDGRSQIRDEKLQKEIDSLKSKDNALRDSINLINTKLKHLHIN